MPGVPDSYTFRTADVVFYYAPQRWCRAAMWLPEGVEDLTDIPVYVIAHGGGWVVTPSLIYLNHYIDRALTLGLANPSTLLANGWAVVYMEYPIAANTVSNNRSWPVARYPFIPRAMGRCIQFIKTHAEDGYLTGSRDSTLSVKDERYVIDGNSAGAIMATWVALQPTGALPFYSDRPQSIDDLFVYRYSHRIRGVVVSEGACYFPKFSSTGISAAAVPYFGFSEDFKCQPKFSEVPFHIKEQASTLPLVQSNTAENRNVGFYVVFGDDQAGVPSSPLGSGTRLTVSNVTGTPAVGDTVDEYNATDGVTSGTGGTVVHWDSDAGLLYIERSSVTRFNTGDAHVGVPWMVREAGGSGWTAEIDVMKGNDNRLAFLDVDDVMALLEDDDNEVPDLEQPHDNIFGYWFYDALADNDAANGATDSLHNYTPSDRYVATLLGTEDTYDARDASVDPVYDWITETLGITT